MAKLSDKQKKKIIAEYVEGSTTRALAAKYGVSQTTIRRVLGSDKEMAQKVSLKKEENAKSVLAYMEGKKNDVCGLIDALLVAMNDPAKIAATPLSQLATSMGTLVNESEVIENCGKSAGIISDETIIAQHPWIDDPQKELERLKAQKEKEAADAAATDPYKNAFVSGKQTGGPDDVDEP